jgi:hypothetical protein
MPLSELPGYMKSARETGQGDDIPVVDMGRIVEDSPRFGIRTLALATFVLASFVGAFAYIAASSRSISIAAADGVDSSEVASIVAEEGGRVFSVMKEENGTYRVRIFTLKSIGSFIEGLRGKKDFKSVELGR